MKHVWLAFVLSFVPFFSKIRAQHTPPKADLIDLVLTEDGTVLNQANPDLPIVTGTDKPEITYVPRYGSYAAHFSGSPQCYYQIDYSRNTAFKQAVQNGFTMEVMYQCDIAGTQSSFSTQQYGGFGFEQSGSKLSFYAYINGRYAQADATTPIESGRVYHTVAVYDKQQGELRLYINGRMEDQTSVNGELGLPTAAVSQWIAIGGDTSAGDDFVQAPLRGVIYRARMFSQPLPEEDVTGLYDKADKTATPAPGLYRISNGKTGTVLRDNLLIEDGYAQKPVPQCTSDNHTELSQLWEVEETDEKGAYLLTNAATGNRLRSVAPARLDKEGGTTHFYAYDNGMYAIECNGYLSASGTTVTDNCGDQESAAAWILTPADRSQLDTYAACTLDSLRTWYRPGNRFDEYAPNAELDRLLNEKPDVETCRLAAEALCVPTQKHIKVLQYNTWNNGRMVTDGRKGIIDAIEQTQPDVMLLQEVRSQEFIDEVIEYFRQKGVTYYGKSMNISTAIVSRYPFESIRNSDELGSGSYAFAKAHIRIGDKTLALYSIHLDWLYLGYYYPRGFDGNSDTTPYAPITPYDNAADVLAVNNKSRRPKEVKALIEDAAKEGEAGNWVIMGGDFNEPSYLDWQENTRTLRNHNNLVINWTCSSLLADAGFKDAYRQCYPNPVTHPGFTCNAGNRWVNPSEYTWSYGVDDRERIDLTYYLPAPGIRMNRATVIGPKEDYYDRAIRYEKTADPILTPNCIWASDHKAVLTEYELSVTAPLTPNRTSVSEGVYYLKAKNGNNAPHTFLGSNDNGKLTYWTANQTDTIQPWTLRATGIGQMRNGDFRFLSRNGTLTGTTYGAQVYTQAGMPDRTAIAFDLQKGFYGYYLLADEKLSLSPLMSPSEQTEPDVFAFRLAPAAQGITLDGHYSEVTFVNNECAGCGQFTAGQVEWIDYLAPDKWKAVYLPGALRQMFRIDTDETPVPDNDIELMQYDSTQKKFVPIERPSDATSLIAPGAYLIRSKTGGWIRYVFRETAFAPKSSAAGSLTGTGYADSRTVRGYTLSNDATRFVFREAAEVGPFEAYIAVGENDVPQNDIILSEPTGIRTVQGNTFGVSVADRRISVTGLQSYRIFNAAGLQVDDRNPLLPGIYVIIDTQTLQTQKVMVK